MRNLVYPIIFLTLLACNSKDKAQDDVKVDVEKPNQQAMVEGVESRLAKVQDSLLARVNEELKADMNNPELYVKRSRIYERFGQLDYAFEDMQRAYMLDSNNVDLLVAYGDFHLRRGDLQISLSYLNQARNLNPESSEVYLKLGELFLIGKNNKRSLQNADLAIKYDKFNAQAYFLKGFNFLEMGDTSRAISSFQTTVEQNPEHFEAYMQLGLLNSIKGDLLAIDYYNNALEVKPFHKEAMYGKAMFMQEHEMYNEAMATYHEVLEHHPDFREAHYNLGYVHMYYLQLYRQATLHFTDAIEADPNYFQAYYNRGYSFELLGDISNAEKDYRKSLEIQPDYDMAAQGLSRIRQ